jgi:hypothetical protein
MQMPGVAQIAIENWSRLRRLKQKPVLGLGPLFSDRRFALLVATHLNPDLDPDRQFRNGRNPALIEAISGYRAVYFGGPFTARTAIDIGRAWRDNRGIGKRIVDGVSLWTEANR